MNYCITIFGRMFHLHITAEGKSIITYKDWRRFGFTYYNDSEIPF